MRLLLQPAAGIIFIYAFEEELFVRSKSDTADEATGVTNLIHDFAPRFAVRLRGRRSGFMLGVVELINGARTVGVERHSDANNVVRSRGWGLSKHRCQPMQADGKKNYKKDY